jgi:hypothetical protein
MNGVSTVSIRPSAVWREAVEEEARLVAAGELEEDFAVTAELFPPELLLEMDGIFETFEQESHQLSGAPDETALAAIRRAVVALNALNEKYLGDAIATDARDRICEYIDDTISAAGVDLDALCERQGVARGELTDRWRTW